MWKLIKTEIKYYRWLYILSIALVILINFGLTMDGRWIEAQNDFPGLRIIWVGISIIIFFFTLLFNRKSGRLRNNVLLPLSKNEIAFSRIIPFMLFWITLVLILFLFYLVNVQSFPTNYWMQNLLSLTGIVLLINSIPVLNTDFYSTYFSKRSRLILGIFWSILWITYIFLNSIFISYLDFILPEFFESSREALTVLFLSGVTTILSILVGVSIFFASIVTFSKRKLFLE